jgi:mono/diheme cytochrome c family protein
MMRRGAAAVLVCATLAAGALAFAQKDPSEQANRQKRRDAGSAKAPASVRSRRNPLEEDPEAVAAGRKLFGRHCQECHGVDAQGGNKAPSLRQEGVQSAAPGVLFWFITNGNVRRGMPPWSKLPEPQRWQLVSFLKSLGTVSSSDLR